MVRVMASEAESRLDEIVDFSAPYFTSPMAVLVGPGAVDTAATMAASERPSVKHSPL